MIARLPKWAELAFASQCAAAGAFAHPPDEDQNGWDYLVEFSSQRYPGPADTHPPAKSAYVQVKSTRGKKLTCRMSLSNALKAAQSMQPWFLVLILADKKTNAAEFYAIHLWEDFVRRALKAVRAAENAGRPLNRCTLTIGFSASDRPHGSLVRWMENVIATHEHEPSYQQRKQAVNGSLFSSKQSMLRICA